MDWQFYCGKFCKSGRNSQAVPCRGRKANAICTVAYGAPSHGSDSSNFGRISGCPVASGSSGCSLRAPGTQVTGDQIWSGYRRRSIELPVGRSVPPRLSRQRPKGCRPGIGVRTRARPSRHPHICGIHRCYFGDTVRQVSRSRSARRGTICVVRKIWIAILEGDRRAPAGLHLRRN